MNRKFQQRMFTIEILEYEAFKGRYVYFTGQVFRKKAIKATLLINLSVPRRALKAQESDCILICNASVNWPSSLCMCALY